MANQVLEKIKAELAIFEEKKKEMLNDLQKEFPTMFTEIFKQAPNLKSYGWTQCTPYFNDGDTCEFSVNFDYPYLNGLDEYKSDISISIYDYKKLVTEEDIRINKELAEIVGRQWYSDKSINDNGLCYNKKYDAAAAKAVTEIKEVLDSIPDDFFKDMFGDHAKVTIYANGEIDVEEYEHD